MKATTDRPHTDPAPADRAPISLAGLGRADSVPARAGGGLLLGRGMDGAGPERITDEVSVGFAQDMSVHHAQAVQ